MSCFCGLFRSKTHIQGPVADNDGDANNVVVRVLKCNGEILNLDGLTTESTVGSVVCQIGEKEGLPAHWQNLFVGDRPICAWQKLGTLSMVNSELDLLLIVTQPETAQQKGYLGLKKSTASGKAEFKSLWFELAGSHLLSFKKMPRVKGARGSDDESQQALDMRRERLAIDCYDLSGLSDVQETGLCVFRIVLGDGQVLVLEGRSAINKQCWLGDVLAASGSSSSAEKQARNREVSKGKVVVGAVRRLRCLPGECGDDWSNMGMKKGGSKIRKGRDWKKINKRQIRKKATANSEQRQCVSCVDGHNPSTGSDEL